MKTAEMSERDRENTYDTYNPSQTKLHIIYGGHNNNNNNINQNLIPLGGATIWIYQSIVLCQIPILWRDHII